MRESLQTWTFDRTPNWIALVQTSQLSNHSMAFVKTHAVLLNNPA